MKTNFFVILFLSVHCLAFNQGIITIPHNSSTPAGVVYNPPSGYAFQNSPSQIHVGKPFTNILTQGRGYLEFNLSSYLTESIISKIDKVELVFDCGSASTAGNHAVSLNIFNSPSINPGLHSQADIAYNELKTFITLLDTVLLKGGISGRIKSINKATINTFYTSTPLPSSPSNVYDAGSYEATHYGVSTNISWSVSGISSSEYSFYNDKDFGREVYIYFYSPYETYYLNLTVSNFCSVGYDTKSITAGYSPSPVASYPNPVGDVLNIEIDANVAANFDIRLYDRHGNLLRSSNARSGNLQFNIANLPEGIYYLHIYDDISSKPEMRQIIVER